MTESSTPDAERVDATNPDDSPARAVASAVGIGLLGPAIALVLSLGVLVLGSTFEIGLFASVVILLVVGQYVSYGGLAIAYLAQRGFDRDRIVRYLGVRVPSLKELAIVVGAWVVILGLLLVISVVLQVLGAETADNQSAQLALDNPALVPLFVVASFLVIGPCEEVLYRGVVQGRLRESLPAAPSIVVASAVFAFVHVIALTGGISGRLTTVAVLFFPSLVFGAVYEYTKNIVVPSLLHGLHNAAIFTLLFVLSQYEDEIQAAAEATVIPVV